ncbi:hypothetical protein niasHS_010951 [Heterodera schachtii]|uniref:Uncharacterized protein n=1 Tax=Heterodera schachtii TaxID=97005 RepID=A0ABD2IT19_HETSC
MEEEEKRGDLGEGSDGTDDESANVHGEGICGNTDGGGCARKRSATGAAAAAVVKFLPGGGREGGNSGWTLPPVANCHQRVK